MVLRDDIRNGDLQKVKVHFENRNIDVNFKSSYCQETAFFVACQCGKLDIIEYVLANERELNVLRKNYRKKSPLEIAKINSKSPRLGSEKNENQTKQRQKGCTSIIKLLEEYQTDPKNVKVRLRKKLNLNGTVL